MDEVKPLSEIQIQGTAWADVWEQFPHLRRCFFHVPNESTYDNKQQTSSGVVPGIQDMFLICKGNVWIIEIKDDKGKISSAQKVVHAAHKVQGFDTYIFRDPQTIVDFVRCVDTFGDNRFYDGFISPYSVAEDYDKLLAEYKASKMKKYLKK